MGSFDRRIVHQALRDDPDVESHSVEVDGTDKKALILRPKRR
jgi:predicted RNA-binding protein Jag